MEDLNIYIPKFIIKKMSYNLKLNLLNCDFDVNIRLLMQQTEPDNNIIPKTHKNKLLIGPEFENN